MSAGEGTERAERRERRARQLPAAVNTETVKAQRRVAECKQSRSLKEGLRTCANNARGCTVPPTGGNKNKKGQTLKSDLEEAATYSPTTKCSTIGVNGLNFSVRNGKRWNPIAITT